MASANFIMISQKQKKMQNKRRKNRMVKGNAKLLLVMCQAHETHVGMAGENSLEKNLCDCEPPGKGWPNITHFQNTLHVSCNIPCTKKISVRHLSLVGKSQLMS